MHSRKILYIRTAEKMMRKASRTCCFDTKFSIKINAERHCVFHRGPSSLIKSENKHLTICCFAWLA